MKNHIPRLQGGFDFEAPSLKQRLRNVLGVLISARPLAQAGRPQVLIGREFVFPNHLFELGNGRGNRPDRLRLAPVGISTSLCHGEEDLSYKDNGNYSVPLRV